MSGLARFGHLMSIDYFQDLLRVLSDLLERKMEYDEEKNFLGSHESLLCIHTVLSILSGQGEALTLDPQKFYRHLDRIISELKVSEVCTMHSLLSFRKVQNSKCRKIIFELENIPYFLFLSHPFHLNIYFSFFPPTSYHIL